MKKPKKIIDGYYMKRQLIKGYKIIEISHFDNEDFHRKRTIVKGLSYMDAENMIYNLERKIGL